MTATAPLDTVESAPDPASDDAPPKSYLHEIDIVRLLTFASVIGVHSLAQASTGDNVAANSVEVILHFTRDAFFALTGFVLFHTNYRRPLDIKKFWWRRFPVVFVPYIVWSTIYFVFWINNHNDTSLFGALQRYGYDLLTGSAQYHLYFLLVSMQIYALFPVLRWVIQKTEKYHWLLLVVVFVADALLSTWQHYAHKTGALLTASNNSQELVLTYLAFVFAGALAAVHLNKFQSWMRSHVEAVIASVVATLVIAECIYAFNMHIGDSASYAAEALQPAIMIWSIAVVLGLYEIGMKWACARKSGRTANVISEASHASFGVYLVHPLMLTLAANIGLSYTSSIPTAISAVGAWLMAVGLSVIFVEYFLRTSLGMPLTGRRSP